MTGPMAHPNAGVGCPSLRYLDQAGPQAQYQLFGIQSRNFCPTSLGFSAPGPPGFDHYGQYNSSINKQGGTPLLVASSGGSLYVATSFLVQI